MTWRPWWPVTSWSESPLSPLDYCKDLRTPVPAPPLRSVLSTATWGPLRCPPQTPGSAAKPGPCAGPAARTPSLFPEHAGHTPQPPRGLTPARHSLLGEPLSPPPTPRLEGSLSSTGDGVCWRPVSPPSAVRSMGLGVSSPHGGPSLEHGGLGEYLLDACAKVCQVRVSPGAPVVLQVPEDDARGSDLGSRLSSREARGHLITRPPHPGTLGCRSNAILRRNAPPATDGT